MRDNVTNTLRIVDVAELSPADQPFVTLSDVDGTALAWRHFSGLPANRLERAITRPRIARYRAAMEAARATRRADALLSHLPRMTTAVANLAKLTGRRVPHLAFAFNFTDLPRCRSRAMMAKAFEQVDQFCVFTQFEVDLYAEAFNIDPARIRPVIWTQSVPYVQPQRPSEQTGRFVVAVGGEGRDYAALVAAARRLPSTNFVVIARPVAALEDVPANMRVLYNISLQDCWSIAAKSELMIVPLLSDRTCCGHITLVSARQLGIPIVTTLSHGTSEYTQGFAGTTLIPAQDSAALTDAIHRVQRDLPVAVALAERDRVTALLCYDRTTWNEYVAEFLRAHVSEKPC